MNLLMIVLAGIIIFVVTFFLLSKVFSGGKSQPIPGKVVWYDSGRQAKVFKNPQFGVKGKLDVILQQQKELVGVEYKSRAGKVFESDIIQGYSACLAAYKTYKFTKLIIKTDTDQVERVITSEQQLFDRIKKHFIIAKAIQSGDSGEPTKNKWKCKGCGRKSSCTHYHGK